MLQSFTCAVVCPARRPVPPEADPFDEAFSFSHARAHARMNAESALQLAEEAASGASLVVLPEDLNGIRHYWRVLEAPHLFRRLAEPIPGPTTKAAGAIARRHKSHLVLGLYENAGRHVYNTTVLLSHRGKILAAHRKTHLAPGEDWLVTPGSEATVVKTALGRVGLVCGEEYLVPETALVLARLDAQIVVCPSRCPVPDILLCSRSFESNFLTVFAQPNGSVLVDQTACVLAQSAGRRPYVLATTFFPHPATEDERGPLENLITGIEDPRRRRSARRRPELYGLLVESTWPEGSPPKARHIEKRKWEAYGYLSQKWEEGPHLLPGWEMDT